MLCSKTFTLADVSLTILLHRLDALGLGHRFWSTDLKPNLNAYYQKVQSREGFKRTVPDMKYHLSAVAHNAPTYMLAGFGISVTALAVLTSLSVYKVMQWFKLSLEIFLQFVGKYLLLNLNIRLNLYAKCQIFKLS